jgi:GTPase Era involved in 16S rRNA processing
VTSDGPGTPPMRMPTGTPDELPEETRREVRELATRGTEIGARLHGLDTAVRAARGRLDDELIADVEGTVDRVGGRLRLSAKHTVIGIAGATGSGKSSTYNSLVGLELSSIGVRRPTTSWASACVWGSDGAEELLQWLGIPPRHQTMRDSLLDFRSSDDQMMDGVVLLDLPDHDSTEVSHHLEVDRLVELADLLVWVLDPQKYADAALHDRYLAPYHTHSDVMLVLLNQIDTIPVEERQSLVDDVRRLLVDDGLPDVKVLAVSAQEGLGMDALRREIQSRVAAKRSATTRAESDIAAAALRLQDDGVPRELAPTEIQRLEESVGDAAGVRSVAATVGRRARARASQAVTWPPLLLGRLFASDPSKSLTVDLGEDLGRVGGSGGEPAPRVAPVSRELVDSAVRDLTDDASRGLPGPWAESVGRAGAATVAGTTVKLGAGLAGVDLGVDRLPGWVRVVQGVQWLLFAVGLGGAAWWVASAVGGGDAAEVGGLPLPAVLCLGGFALGILLAVVCMGLVRSVAKRRSAEVHDDLQDVISEVVSTTVVRPVSQELSAYAAFKVGLTEALA